MLAKQALQRLRLTTMAVPLPQNASELRESKKQLRTKIKTALARLTSDQMHEESKESTTTNT